jgi:hypothetical protein
MSKFEFFSELKEARIFKNLNLVDGTKADDLAILMLNMFFALNFIWHEDRASAVKYARNIMSQPGFKGFRTTQPDLYNAITLLLHQEKYSDKLITRYDITIPELRIKRILRDMSGGRVDEDDYHQLFLLMMRTIKGVSSDHQRVRRQLRRYDEMTSFDKIRNLRWLMLQMRTGKARYSDMYPMLQKIWNRLT